LHLLLHRLHNNILLRLKHVNLVRHRDGGAHLAGRIVGKHDVHLKSEATLAEKHMANSRVDEVAGWVTSSNHVAIGELHALGALATDLSRHHDRATEGTVLHDEADDTIACTTDGKSSEELETEGLALSHGAEATVQDLLSVQLDGASWEAETLLHNSCELANAAALLSEDVLGAGGTDDDLVASRGLTDLNTRVAILSEFTHEELVQFSVEYAIGNKLALLGYVLGSLVHNAHDPAKSAR